MESDGSKIDIMRWYLYSCSLQLTNLSCSVALSVLLLLLLLLLLSLLFVLNPRYQCSRGRFEKKFSENEKGMSKIHYYYY